MPGCNVVYFHASVRFSDAGDGQKNRSTPFDLSTIPVVKIADLGNACWTVSCTYSLSVNN